MHWMNLRQDLLSINNKQTMSSIKLNSFILNCSHLLEKWNLWMRHPCLAPNPFAGEKLPDHPLLVPSYWCWISLIHPAWSKQKHFPTIIWLHCIFFYTGIHKNKKRPYLKVHVLLFYTIYILAYNTYMHDHQEMYR